MLTVPGAVSACLPADQTTVSVTWATVTATNADSQPISCSYDNGGTSQSVTESDGTFPVGTHTVTCTVTNNGGCQSSQDFVVTVSGT